MTLFAKAEFSQTKYDIKKTHEDRIRAALAILEPRWKQCTKIKPRGHIFIGMRPAYARYYHVCSYCGALAPYQSARNDPSVLERLVLHMDEYPIARDHNVVPLKKKVA